MRMNVPSEDYDYGEEAQENPDELPEGILSTTMGDNMRLFASEHESMQTTDLGRMSMATITPSKKK